MIKMDEIRSAVIDALTETKNLIENDEQKIKDLYGITEKICGHIRAMMIIDEQIKRWRKK